VRLGRRRWAALHAARPAPPPPAKPARPPAQGLGWGASLAACSLGQGSCLHCAACIAVAALPGCPGWQGVCMCFFLGGVGGWGGGSGGGQLELWPSDQRPGTPLTPLRKGRLQRRCMAHLQAQRLGLLKHALGVQRCTGFEARLRCRGAVQEWWGAPEGRGGGGRGAVAVG
jgi:hypothetical protein